ncbi:hypothetical protein HO133_005849 [Letharia lupina]|uniref:Uncharacterized protein n=1 Tax=Letharia lupina TaxID=560253 RepID=A0A8H6C7X6_9LECA|nr:uncharacterized protein HO133_005849 [Letharia lupina]KAF6218500.1 hypothetical protein HO133_005849 [Letharia lupina]
MSTASTPSADDINPAVGRFNLRPKVSFHVAYDLGRGDEAQPIRVTVPKDESYDKFLWRLYNVFYGDSFEKSLRQWEYVLVNRQYERGDPLPLTSPNTYYAMVSELLRARSQWRHAVVRRSHSENPIIKAIVEGTYNPKPDSPILNAATPDPRLPDSPPIPDASIADTPMPDAPTGQATPELLASTPPSRAWVVTSATARPSNRTPSPGPPSRAYARELSTPSTPVTSARGRRLLQLSSPLAPAAGARSPTRFNLPLISSPLRPVSSDGGRRSMRLGSPVASVTSASKPSQVSSPIAPVTSASLPSQLGPPLAPVTSAQSPNLLDSSPLASQSPATLLGSITSPATGAPIPSIQLGPPSVPAASARRASIHLNSPSIQLSLPIIPTTSAPTPPAVLPIVSSPLSPQDPGSEVDLGEPNSRLAPALIAPHPPATPPIASGSRSSRTPVPELFQRSHTSSADSPNGYISTSSALVDHLQTASKQCDRISRALEQWE